MQVALQVTRNRRKAVGYLCRLLALAAWSASPAHAASGKVLFATGQVTAELNRAQRALQAGDGVEVGETVVTGDKARAQLLLLDGQRIALRAASRFRIDAFSLPAGVRAPGAQATAVQAAGQSLFTLQAGGLRTRTAATGKTDPAAYQMRTPVGTLGIRGTDYTIIFCRGDCFEVAGAAAGTPARDGLYIVVDEGRIVFGGRGIEFELGAGQSVFVPLEEASPERLREPPAFMRTDAAGLFDLAGVKPREAASNSPKLSNVNDRRAPAGEQGAATEPPPNGFSDGVARPVGAASAGGSAVDLTPGLLPLKRGLSYGFGTPAPGLVAGSYQTATNLAVDAAGNLIRFDAPLLGAAGGVLSIGTAGQIDLGASVPAGLRWGRWTGGAVSYTPNGGTPQSIDLAQRSMPWILGPELRDTVVLPTTGTASFGLVGGTRPTGSAGAVGTLGNAFLSANFTTQAVTAAVALDLGGVSWYASGNGAITAGGFSGSFGTVTINQVVNGSGEFAGFFTDATAGGTVPRGAGLTFLLNDPLNQLGRVTGVAALQQGTGTAPVAPLAPQRYVAYASTGLVTGAATAQRLGDIQIDAANAVAQNGAGALTRFVAETRVGGARSDAQFDIGLATAVDTGVDAGTGIRWGRWAAGTGSVTPSGQSAVAQPYASQSLAWLLGPLYGVTPALPTDGVRAYGLVGSTQPVSGATTGALGGAAFSADFAARTVATSMVADVGGRRWYLTGSGGFVAGTSNASPAGFAVQSADGNVGRIAAADLNLDGFFVGAQYGVATSNGAGVSYTAAAAAGRSDEQRLAGVAVFSDAVAATTVVAPAGRRDILFGFGAGPFRTQSQAAAQYDLSAGFDPTRFAAQVFNGQLGAFVPQTFSLATASNVNTGYDLRPMLRWGRWTNGTAQAVDAQGATAGVDLTDRSLHWITGADSAAPVLPVSGTQTYTLVGATAPTATLGRVGTLGGAFAAADFTNRTVDVTISLDMTGHNFYGTGRGTLATGDYRFGAVFSDARRDGVAGDASGQFAGFFTFQPAAGATPQGLGISYSFVDATGVEPGSINGVAALLAGPGSPPVPPTASTRLYALVLADLVHPVQNESLTLIDSGLRLPQLDGSGNLRAITAINPFVLPPPVATRRLFVRYQQSNLNTGSDAALGLRWGSLERWQCAVHGWCPSMDRYRSRTNSLALGGSARRNPARRILPQSGLRRYGLTGVDAADRHLRDMWEPSQVQA